MSPTRALAVAALSVLFVWPSPVFAQLVAYGDSVALGNGMATTWVEVDEGSAPLRIGMTLTEGVLMGLPTTERVFSLELPRVASDSLFQHVLFDWVPHGHTPSGVYTLPHFDFHFYMISRQERMLIWGGYDSVPVPPIYMPQDYIPVPGLGTYSIPQMGVHYADMYAPELNGETFSKTLIYGFYRGEMIFVEPMIRRTYLLGLPNDKLPIKQPEAFQRAGYYPMSYQIRHDAEREVYDVFLSDFVWRDATVVSADDAAATSALTLAQNFPNPFHDATVIEYHLPEAGRVLLEVHDVLGRRVALLVDEVQPPGSYSSAWDAGEVASGLYFFVLRTNGGMLARSAVVAK